MDLNLYPALPVRKDFRIGILGSGFIVNDCHLVAYRKAGFNLVAIASRSRDNAERVAKGHGIARVHDGYEQLLDDPSIEVLDIAVLPTAQLGLIKAACARKTVKGILAQKPLGMNYAEALEAVQACEAAGITLAVNQNMRYDHSVRAAKTLLENGTIGEPVFATIEMRAIPHWMPWQKDLGWLTLRIMSIHHLDTFRYWFGEPEGIYCSVRTDPRTKFPHTDGICTYILEYANGLRCVATDDTWAGPAKEGCASENYIKWRIEGTNGLAIGDIGWCKDPFTTPSDIRYASKGHAHFECPTWKESWFPDAFIGTMAQLLLALETRTEPAISGRDNLKTMALVEAAYISVKERRQINPKHVEFQILPQVYTIQNPPNNLGVVHLPPKDFRAPQFSKTENKLSNWLTSIGDFFYGRSKATVSAKPVSAKAAPTLEYTPAAQTILTFARREAERLNHGFVGTEHLLISCLQADDCLARKVLQSVGVDSSALHREIIEKFPPGSGPTKPPLTAIPYTPRLKRVLALALKEARESRQTQIRGEHLLLALIQEKQGPAARLLEKYQLNPQQIRSLVLRTTELAN